MGSDSQHRVVEHWDLVNPTYRWRYARTYDRGESARQGPQARIEMCVARLAELQIESARAAAELTSKGGPTGFRTRELSPERLQLLRKLGALKIERAEIDRELAALTAARQLDKDQDQLPTRPLP
jgi:hypothetical protein